MRTGKMSTPTPAIPTWLALTLILGLWLLASSLDYRDERELACAPLTFNPATDSCETPKE
jgi:hypothetical protein